MQVNYCDLCSAPIKEGNFYMLYMSEPKDKNSLESLNDYHNYMDKVEKGVKEICPTCKHIFDRMFQLRLQRLSELTEELNLTYNLTSKKNPKERKNGKDKK